MLRLRLSITFSRSRGTRLSYNKLVTAVRVCGSLDPCPGLDPSLKPLYPYSVNFGGVVVERK
jgi:hypothetical protein